MAYERYRHSSEESVAKNVRLDLSRLFQSRRKWVFSRECMCGCVCFSSSLQVESVIAAPWPACLYTCIPVGNLHACIPVYLLATCTPTVWHLYTPILASLLYSTIPLHTPNLHTLLQYTPALYACCIPPIYLRRVTTPVYPVYHPSGRNCAPGRRATIFDHHFVAG